jgi:hypothetical protein
MYPAIMNKTVFRPKGPSEKISLVRPTTQLA